MKPAVVVDHTSDSFLLHWLVLEKECPLEIELDAGLRPVRAPYYHDSEVVIADHATLIQFLQERYPGIQLLPTDPVPRAQIRQACQMVRDREKGLKRQILDVLAAGGPWMLGREFTLLDVYVGSWLMDRDVPKSGLLHDYYKRLLGREAFRTALQ